MTSQPQNSRGKCNAGRNLTFALSALTLTVVLALGTTAGCGANGQDVAYQAGSAVGNTIFDLLLTQFTNQLVDAFDQQNQPADDGADDGGDDDGGDDGADDGGDDGGADDGGADDGGDAPGATIFANRCSSCHGDGGTGGFAGDLAGRDLTTEINDRFGGGATHGGQTLTDDEMADVVEYLASL